MHSGPRPDAQKQATTIHEAGHFIGMVSDLQTSHYVDHGHNGPHCSTGLTAAELAQDSYRGQNGTCVMFGESARSRQPKFCAACDRSVREATIRVMNNMPSSADSWSGESA
jgi:hypothetical protein